jgi:uncharacterized membrane protein SirB2
MELLQSHPWLYPALLHLHRTAVTASVLLFTARGVGTQLDHAWPSQQRWRRTSVVIDTTLLLAGAGLWYVVSHNPWQEPWLATKLGLLPVYIVLGSLALGRARSRRARLACFVAALACVSAMAHLALTRTL